MGRLVCVGDTVIDVAMSVEAMPEPGGDILADSGALYAGGTGFNVMAAASRLGTECDYAGMHGTGPFGDLARKAMLEEGIRVLHEADPDADTGWDVAITDSNSERTFMTVVGAEAKLTAEHLARVEVQSGDVVYVSGYGLLGEPGGPAIANWLGVLPAGVQVVVDPGPLVADIPKPIFEAVLSSATWWSCNEREVELTTGIADPAKAAEQLAKATGGVLLRVGAEGCLIAGAGSDLTVIPGFPVKAVDSNGAGDNHIGAFISGLLDGMEPAAAARRANAAAAIAVTKMGPATGPTTKELEEFLAMTTVK